MLGQVLVALAAKGLEPSHVADSFDLLIEGVIDSFGIIELIVKLEARYGFEIDFTNLDPDDLTRIGPVSRLVEEQGRFAIAGA